MGERVTFSSSTGPNLAGTIEVPERVVRGWGVFAHGFTLGKDSQRPNHRGLGRRIPRRSVIEALSKRDSQ